MSVAAYFARGFPLGPGLIVPWFSEIDALEEFGGVLQVQHKIYKSMDFGERIILGEVRAKIILSFYTETPTFTITPLSGFESAVQAFRHFLGPAIAIFGSPTDFTEDAQYPGACWKDGPFEVRLGVGNRFTDYFTFTVSRADWRNQDLTTALARQRRWRICTRLVLPMVVISSLATIALLRGAA